MYDKIQSRLNIINNLLKPNGIRHPRVIHAFQEVSRETFLKQHVKGTDQQKSLNILVIATILQALSIKLHDRILVIGSMNLFIPALLSFCCKEIFIVIDDKNNAQLIKQQSQNFPCATFNINFSQLHLGLDHAAPFDHIIIEGGVYRVDQPIRDQLKQCGHLIYLTPLDNYISYRLILENKIDNQNFTLKVINECAGFMLDHFHPTLPKFQF